MSLSDPTRSQPPQLTPEDQARVDRVLGRGVYAAERKPFRPWLLMGMILVVLTAMSGISYWIAWMHGVV